MSEGNYQSKTSILKQLLEDIKRKKEKHYFKFRRLRLVNMVIKAVVNGLNAVSVSSIVMSFQPIHQVVLIVALTSTSISGILSAVTNAVDFDGRVSSHQTSYQQYGDIHRDISSRLLRNGLSSEDLDMLLCDLNVRLGLVEDTSLPI